MGRGGTGFYYNKTNEVLPYSEPGVLLNSIGSKLKDQGNSRKERWCELRQRKRLQKQRAISKGAGLG